MLVWWPVDFVNTTSDKELRHFFSNITLVWCINLIFGTSQYTTVLKSMQLLLDCESPVKRKEQLKTIIFRFSWFFVVDFVHGFQLSVGNQWYRHVQKGAWQKVCSTVDIVWVPAHRMPGAWLGTYGFGARRLLCALSQTPESGHGPHYSWMDGFRPCFHAGTAQPQLEVLSSCTNKPLIIKSLINHINDYDGYCGWLHLSLLYSHKTLLSLLLLQLWFTNQFCPSSMEPNTLKWNEAF